MEKIKRFIECLVPVSVCNLHCDYCYIIYQNRRKNKLPKFEYSPEHIGKALTKERLGGTCYFSICGAGETLVPVEMKRIIEEILKQGHYVNVTTNGTLSKRFDEILEIPKELLSHLQFSFSFHYLELKKLNMLDVFFENVNKVRKSGCSFLVQLNLYDKYIPHIEEIKKICLEKVGALPQIAATRKEEIVGRKKVFNLQTNLSVDEYRKIGNEFKSPLFDFTMNNFNVKRKEFCYAGEWSFLLNLATGNIKRCYAEPDIQNIFKDINKKIKFCPVGNCCKSRYCVNSSHFMSLGVIPELKTPTYVSLRDRKESDWYNKDMKKFLNCKLSENNKEYNDFEKKVINTKNFIDNGLYNCTTILKRIVRKIIKRNYEK